MVRGGAEGNRGIKEEARKEWMGYLRDLTKAQQVIVFLMSLHTHSPPALAHNSLKSRQYLIHLSVFFCSGTNCPLVLETLAIAGLQNGRIQNKGWESERVQPNERIRNLKNRGKTLTFSELQIATGEFNIQQKSRAPK